MWGSERKYVSVFGNNRGCCHACVHCIHCVMFLYAPTLSCFSIHPDTPAGQAAVPRVYVGQGIVDMQHHQGGLH